MINIENIWDLNFIGDIEQKTNSRVYAVGGCVRDYLMGYDSKDIDLVVCGLSQDLLGEILSNHGKIDFVGESFGVMKFKPTGYEDVIDVALPRKEENTGDGHRDFAVTVSDDVNEISLTDDLYRRDLTLNAIAMDSNFNYIDPYNGINDINKGLIRHVNPDAFIDDPLRMLRAIQFAARFGYIIEVETFMNIQDNINLIKNITTERVLMEFNKVYEDGFLVWAFGQKTEQNFHPLEFFAQLLNDTGLFETYFGIDIRTSFDDFQKGAIEADLYYLLFAGHDQLPSYWYKEILGGNNENYKILKGLEEIFYPSSNNNRKILSNALLYGEQVILSGLIPEKYYDIYFEFVNGEYPFNVDEMAIDGYDIMEKGYEGKQIGELKDTLLMMIYEDKIENYKPSLLKAIS